MTTLRASDLVAQRIRQIRKRRDWNVRKLAERCAEAGAPEITAAVLANIEHGRPDEAGRRRRDVTVDEAVSLAYALGVPPVLLFVPLDAAEALQVTGDAQMDLLTAVGWATGDRSDAGSVRADEMPLELLRKIRSALDRANFFRLHLEGNIPPVPGGDRPMLLDPETCRAGLAEIGRDVACLNDWLASLGFTPPELPADIAAAMQDQDAREAS